MLTAVTRRRRKRTLNHNRLRLIRLAQEQGWEPGEIAEALEVHPRTVKRRIDDLKAIEEHGPPEDN